jgi:hypothetical protein
MHVIRFISLGAIHYFAPLLAELVEHFVEIFKPFVVALFFGFCSEVF